MTTTEQLVLQNTGGKGFSVAVLEEFRSLPKVVRVDGRGFRENGRFAEVVIHFAESGLAEKFMAIALESFGDEIERVK